MSQKTTVEWFSTTFSKPQDEGVYLVTCLGVHRGNPIKYVQEVRYLEDEDGKWYWYVDLNGPGSYTIADHEVVAWAETPTPYDITTDDDPRVREVVTP